MIRSVLLNKLKNSILLQFIFGFLPILIIILYLIFYMNDLSRIVYTIDYNDKVLRQERLVGNANFILEMKTIDDSTTLFELYSPNIPNIEIGYGDTIFKAYYIDNEFVFITYDDMQYYSDVCQTVTFSSEDERLYVDSKPIELDEYGLIYTLSLDEDGNFIVDYFDDTIEDKVLPEFKGVYNEKFEDGLFSLKICIFKLVPTNSLSYNFCSIIDGKLSMLSNTSNTVLSNVGEDFAKNFISGSNIVVVLFSMTVYMCLLIFISRKHDIKQLYSKEVVFANSLSLFLILVAMLITKIVLG